ncbi:MAG TPA: glucose-6-phosphate isomerase [Deltaproteobacteria bacterium]|nr:glucose-6-phosphate isomerase [Deltaproteobacteria bacterium]
MDEVVSVGGVRYALGSWGGVVSGAVELLERERFSHRLWVKDGSLWKEEPGHRALIEGMLGWLSVPMTMADRTGSLKGFAETVREAGFGRTVLLGMGGSSLAPLVLARTFFPRQGWPDLLVVDTTDPAAVKRVENEIDPATTLFVVSSKSGSTIEPNCLFDYFFAKVEAARGGEAGGNFVAITDPGSPLVELSKEYSFRHLFLNFSDIGGRYSALSYFGLVPAALMGLDIDRLLESAIAASGRTLPGVSVRENPAAFLGAVLGALAKEGRDKVTFLLTPEIAAFGLWAEQLLAESTGKEGRGIVPLGDEPPARSAGLYGDDRVFVHLRLGAGGARERLVEELEAAGHPTVTIELETAYELGREFYRWEVAAAAAGKVLGINPFDQPDVEEAKKRSRALLEGPGRVETPEGLEAAPGVSLAFGRATARRIAPSDDAGLMFGDFLSLASAGDYLALLVYADPDDERVTAFFDEVRRGLLASTGRAVQLGYGPRYLHSTGQLHKGGPDNGLFIIVVHRNDDGVAIPGRDYTFADLETAQALGDMESLDAKGRRVALVMLDDLTDETFGALRRFLSSTL